MRTAARWHSSASSAPAGSTAAVWRWLSRAMLKNTSACSSSMYASALARAHLCARPQCTINADLECAPEHSRLGRAHMRGAQQSASQANAMMLPARPPHGLQLHVQIHSVI